MINNNKKLNINKLLFLINKYDSDINIINNKVYVCNRKKVLFNISNKTFRKIIKNLTNIKKNNDILVPFNNKFDAIRVGLSNNYIFLKPYHF